MFAANRLTSSGIRSGVLDLFLLAPSSFKFIIVLFADIFLQNSDVSAA